MTITDVTYYQTGRKKQIPNTTNSSGVGTSNTETQLQQVIIESERQLFNGIFPRALYIEFENALADLPSADQKWKDLIEGVDYTKDGTLVRFEGLRGYEKDSLVAYYVFCEYMERDDSYYSTTGTVAIKQSGAVNYGGTRKYNDAWNTFVKYYQNDLHTHGKKYLVNQCDEIVGIDYYSQESEYNLITLETYLEDHKSDFEGYTFKRYERKNFLDV